MKRIFFWLVAIALQLPAVYGQGSVNIGQAHNKALEGYYKKYGEGGMVDAATLTKRLYQINKELYPSMFEGFSEADSERLALAVFGSTDMAGFDFKERGRLLLGRFVSENRISKELAALMASFIENHPAKDEMALRVDAFLKSGQVSATDKALAEDFKAVFLSSEVFWASMGAGNNADYQARRGCNPGDQRSFADGFGSLIGGVLGSSFPGFGTAVGGFLGGQGMSAVVRMIQNHHGGGCI